MSVSNQLFPVLTKEQQTFFDELFQHITARDEDSTKLLLQSQSHAPFQFQFEENKPLLHLALLNQFSVQCIQLLYPFTPYPHLWDTDRKTALHLAAYYPTTEMVEYFLNNHLKKFKSFSIAYILSFYIKMEKIDLLELILEKIKHSDPLDKTMFESGLKLAIQKNNVKVVKFFLHFFFAFFNETTLSQATTFLHKTREEILPCIKNCIVYILDEHQMNTNAARVMGELIELADTTKEVRDIYQQFQRIPWLSFIIKLKILIFAKDKMITLCKSESYTVENEEDKLFLKVQLKGTLFADNTHVLQYDNIMKKKKTKECWCLIL